MTMTTTDTNAATLAINTVLTAAREWVNEGAKGAWSTDMVAADRLGEEAIAIGWDEVARIHQVAYETAIEDATIIAKQDEMDSYDLDHQASVSA